MTCTVVVFWLEFKRERVELGVFAWEAFGEWAFEWRQTVFKQSEYNVGLVYFVWVFEAGAYTVRVYAVVFEPEF